MPIQHWSDQIWVVELSEDPAFAEEMEVLDGELRARAGHDADDEAEADRAAQAAERGGRVALPCLPDVVVDLAKVEHVNSSNLSQLLRLRKLVVEHDGRLVLAGTRDPVWAVFLSTGLDKVFKFAPDHALALAELQIEAQPD